MNLVLHRENITKYLNNFQKKLQRPAESRNGKPGLFCVAFRQHH